MRAAALPDDLEMILEEHRLSVSVALLSFVVVDFLHKICCRLSLQHLGFLYRAVTVK
jgi:hypothetical protein